MIVQCVCACTARLHRAFVRYGQNSKPGIPANSTLIFTITCEKIASPSESTNTPLDAHAQQEFNIFKTRFGKEYGTMHEEHAKFLAFADNLNLIEGTNAKDGLTYDHHTTITTSINTLTHTPLRLLVCCDTVLLDHVFTV